MNAYRDELIQVAAVAVAIVQDLDTGSAKVGLGDLDEVMNDVRVERKRQNARFGAQHHTDFGWSGILIEEIGEWAAEVLERATDITAEEFPIYKMLMKLTDMEQPARDWLEAHDWGEL